MSSTSSESDASIRGDFDSWPPPDRPPRHLDRDRIDNCCPVGSHLKMRFTPWRDNDASVTESDDTYDVVFEVTEVLERPYEQEVYRQVKLIGDDAGKHEALLTAMCPRAGTGSGKRYHMKLFDRRFQYAGNNTDGYIDILRADSGTIEKWRAYFELDGGERPEEEEVLVAPERQEAPPMTCSLIKPMGALPRMCEKARPIIDTARRVEEAAKMLALEAENSALCCFNNETEVYSRLNVAYANDPAPPALYMYGRVEIDRKFGDRTVTTVGLLLEDLGSHWTKLGTYLFEKGPCGKFAAQVAGVCDRMIATMDLYKHNELSGSGDFGRTYFLCDSATEPDVETGPLPISRMVTTGFGHARLVRPVVQPVRRVSGWYPKDGGEDVEAGAIISEVLAKLAMRACSEHARACWDPTISPDDGHVIYQQATWEHTKHPVIQASMKKSADADAALRAAGWTDELKIESALQMYGGLPPNA